MYMSKVGGNNDMFDELKDVNSEMYYVNNMNDNKQRERINSANFKNARIEETNQIKDFFKNNGYTMVISDKLKVGNKYYIISQSSLSKDEHMEVVEKYFNVNGKLCDKEKFVSTGTYVCIDVPTQIWEFNWSLTNPIQKTWTQPVQSNPITRYGGKKTKSKTKNQKQKQKRSMRTSKTKRRFKKHKKTRRK